MNQQLHKMQDPLRKSSIPDAEFLQAVEVILSRLQTRQPQGVEDTLTIASAPLDDAAEQFSSILASTTSKHAEECSHVQWLFCKNFTPRFIRQRNVRAWFNSFLLCCVISEVFQASGLIINRLQARQPQVAEGPGRPSELQQQVRRGPNSDREATKRDLTTFDRRDRELDRKVPDIESCLLREVHHIPRHL